MLKESRFSPSEADRLVADAQQGFDEDNDQTGLTYQLLMKLVMNGMPRREILISKYSPLKHPIIGILNFEMTDVSPKRSIFNIVVLHVLCNSSHKQH